MAVISNQITISRSEIVRLITAKVGVEVFVCTSDFPNFAVYNKETEQFIGNANYTTNGIEFSEVSNSEKYFPNY